MRDLVARVQQLMVLPQGPDLHAGVGRYLALLGRQQQEHSEEDIEGEVYDQDPGLRASVRTNKATDQKVSRNTLSFRLDPDTETD